MTTMDVSDKGFNEILTGLHGALIADGRTSDAATVVEDQSRLWLKQAIKFTPPKTKAQGENAIKGDLGNAFSVVEDDFAQYVASHYGTSNVDHWLHNDVSNQTYEVKWDQLDVQGYGMDAWHASMRDSRGRIRRKPAESKTDGKWTARYVVSKSAFNAFFAKLKQHVGMMKAGWLRAYYEIGGKLPSWIGRHASRELGGVVNQLAVKGNPSFTMINRAPGIGNFAHIARETFRARGESMRKNIKLILSGYAKDVAAKIRPRKHAQRSGESFFAE